MEKREGYKIIFNFISYVLGFITSLVLGHLLESLEDLISVHDVSFQYPGSLYHRPGDLPTEREYVWISRFLFVMREKRGK
jgi:hypothetical protein